MVGDDIMNNLGLGKVVEVGKSNDLVGQRAFSFEASLHFLFRRTAIQESFLSGVVRSCPRIEPVGNGGVLPR